MNKNKYALIRSIWFWYFITTIIYVLLGLVLYGGQDPTVMGRVIGFVGLFVPYGLLSLLTFSIGPVMSWLSVVVFILLMYPVGKWIKQKNLSIGKTILCNLLALLLLTMLVDIIRQTPFASWRIFLDGTASGVDISHTKFL